MKALFIGKNGLRGGWKAAFVVMSASVLLGAVGWALSAILARLIPLWGVNARNVALAPTWLRLLLAHRAELIGIVQFTLLWPLSLALMRLLRMGKLAWRGLLRGAFAGGAVAALVLGALFLIDALRLGWPLARPRLSFEILIPLAYQFARALGGATLFLGAVPAAFDHYPPIWRAALGGVIFGALGPLGPLGAAGPIGIGAVPSGLMLALNAALVGFTALSLGRTGCALGYTFFLSFPLYVLMGANGASSAGLYESYPAAHDLLSGAAQGPMGGLMMALALGALGGALAYKMIKTMHDEDNDEAFR
ncbi:MAG: hypothetical protein RSJ41_09470 [Clostridia bacterium]